MIAKVEMTLNTGSNTTPPKKWRQHQKRILFIYRQQQDHPLKTDRTRSHRGGGGRGFNYFYDVRVELSTHIKLSSLHNFLSLAD